MAVANGTQVTQAAGSVIPAFGQCALGVDVYGTLTGTYTNVIPAGSLTTSQGNSSEDASAELTISLLANLQVTKVASATSTLPSQTRVFTVTVVNLGPSPVTGAPFTDTMAGMTIVGAVVLTTGGGGSVTSMITSTTSINATMTLPVNGSVSYRIIGLPSSYNGFVTNTATALPPAGVNDANLSNNTASVSVYVQPAANLSVSKTNFTNSISGATPTIYTIIFANAGLSAADGAVVKDTPSAGLICTALTCNATGGASCGGMSLASFLSAGGHILPSLPAGSTVTVQLTCSTPLTGL
ncbi:MAG: hypothetical protein HC858_04850 [Brachymonas sp.]|nr:hypothetical protein [Brachymonas sp.]